MSLLGNKIDLLGETNHKSTQRVGSSADVLDVCYVLSYFLLCKISEKCGFKYISTLFIYRLWINDWTESIINAFVKSVDHNTAYVSNPNSSLTSFENTITATCTSSGPISNFLMN